jgi:cold shock CspA family protein
LNLTKKMICLSLAIVIWGAGNAGFDMQTAQTAETGEDRPFDHVVTGTLDQLDFDTGKGLLKTDLGKPIFFQMIRPELFKRLSVGQRVTIGMNEQGHAVKVMEVPPVELPIPPSAVQ